MGQKAGQGAEKATTAWTQTSRALTCPFHGVQTQEPRLESNTDSTDLTAHLLEGEGCMPVYGAQPRSDKGRLSRHLLDCAVRASMVGVKTPTPISERAASWKWYSVSGFRSSRV